MATAGVETSSCTPAAIQRTDADQQRCREECVGGGSFIAWIRHRTDTLCDLAANTRSAGGDYDKVRLLVELQGWRSYLLEISQKLALRSPSPSSSRLCQRKSETLLELSKHVNRLWLLEETIVVGSGRRTLVDFSVDQIVKDIANEVEQIGPNDVAGFGILEEKMAPSRLPVAGKPKPPSSASSTSHTADPMKPALRNKAVELKMPTLMNEAEPKMPASRKEAEPKMPTFRNKGAVAAGGSQLSPFHMEVFDLKAAVAALSGPPMAKLKMQVETKDEVFLLWEAGDKTVEPPPAAANIHTHVLSAQLKGYDTNHRGRVDYQLFSPLIDFNLEEESSLQPGRHTDALAPRLTSSANILSIKVADSSVGFPIHLYGSVFVKDTLDNEGIYLFRRERGDAQLINSKDETLILTGPSRGLVVSDYLTFEFDLKMRLGDQQADDLGFSQGTIEYNSIFSEPPFLSDKLSSQLSTMELNYAPVRRALEATVEIQIAQDSSNFPASTRSEDESQLGKLYGKISACYTSSTKEIVLFDSDVSGTMFAVGDDGVLELWRRVLPVCVQDSIVVTVETWGDDDGELVGLSRVATKSSFVFSPLLCGEGRAIVPFARFKMQIKVVWSALYIPKLDG